MNLVYLFSGLLMAGMAVSQLLDLSAARAVLTQLTMACLAYIMIGVGLEFVIDKKRLGVYGKDYLVAATAAAFPWIFCALYFIWVLDTQWKEALLVGRFAAPTSAGILFAMLAAAGLASTWLFRKVQVLAIFDDLDTILLMIPLKIMLVGPKPELWAVVAVIVVLLWAAYRYLHRLKWPTGRGWVFVYGIVLTGLCVAVEKIWHIHIEVLLPAFALGCILYNPHDPSSDKNHAHEHAFIEPESRGWMRFDRLVKCAFMFLVGCSLPKISFAGVPAGQAVLHVVLLTLLANIGKCFPLFCYKSEATFRQRLAVCVAMFPRGEVGAGVLLVAISYGMTGLPVALAGLSLALNLLMTGLFIAIVIRLQKTAPVQPQSGGRT